MFNYTKNFKSRWKEMVKFNDIGWLNDKLANAAGDGDLQLVKEYLFLGVDIHADDNHALRWAALRWAAENGHKEVVVYLVEQINLRKKAL